MFTHKTRRRIRTCMPYAVSSIPLMCIVVISMNLISEQKHPRYLRAPETEGEAIDSVYYDTSGDEKFNISEVPLFVNTSLWHYKTSRKIVMQDKVQNEGKFLIYKCTVRCGGLGDRLRGIANTYILALITGRRFGISHPTPCPLQHFLTPNKYNWIIDHSLLLKKPFKTFNLLSKLELPSKNMTNYFKEDVVYLKSNTDLTFHLRQQLDVPKRTPWLTSLTTADIYRSVFNYLFKLHPLLREELRKFRSKYAKNSTTVCAHFRVGKNPTMEDDPERYVGDIKDMWKFFETYNTNGNVIYLATDSDDVKVAAREKFPKRFIDIPGKIVHTEKNEDDKECSGFRKAVLEHAWLIECDILLLTDSGFGRTAGFWRANSQNLFCLQITGVLMCSRDTLPHVLPGSYSPLAWKFDP